MIVATSLADNLHKVNETIAEHAGRVGRDPTGVTIVAVTKTFPVSVIREAMALGLRIFGENRIQEAVPKIDEIGTTGVSWHLIGHLQSNKVKFIEGRFAMVESIDSSGIVQGLGRRLHQPLDVLIEVNVGEEPQKTGAVPADVPAIAASLQEFPQLRLRGLMTIAPMVPDPEQARPVFRRLRALRDETGDRLGVQLPVLSMGMTEDYPVAVQEGATMLRLGRALFGPRPPLKAR
ncbi:MAG TPA: YggS family pyridoxal phosphate-dependent enzyme [Candidatus Acidoferrum sp.]|nr:YggS family pyridoxal phosphate-dependent enzyme [Candidatus Acidoferrum sp.]